MDVTAEFSGPEVIGLLGAVVVVVAPFLPWVTASLDAAPVGAVVISTGLSGIGGLTALLAVLAGFVLLTPDVGRERAVATGLVGVAVVAVGLRVILELPAIATPGSGLYLAVAGGLALVVGALLDYAALTEPESGTPQ